MEQYAEDGLRKRKKRRILIIKKKLQLHFGVVVFISVFIATAIVGWDIYYTVHYKLLKFFAIDPDLALNLKLTNALLLAKLIIYGMIVFLISLFISNKVAGPIFRFEQSCEEIGEGDLTYRVRLRKSDELIDLQDKFNLMVDSLQSKMHRIKQLAIELNAQDTAKIKELQDEINNQFKLD